MIKEPQGKFYKEADDDFRDLEFFMWEFEYKGVNHKFALDKEIEALPKERLERLNYIWSKMIIETYEKAHRRGRDEALEPLRKIRKML